MSERYHDHLVIIVAKEHYNPLSMIRSLGRRGINPIYIAIKGKGKIASSNNYISLCYYTNSVQEAFELFVKKYGCEKESPFVLLTDDETLGYIDNRYNIIKNTFILFNAGTTGRLNAFMNKFMILKLAERFGLKTLNTIVCNKGDIPKRLEYPLITKTISPIVGGWKSDVFICENKDELLKAYKSIQSPVVILQKYIDKQNEYCLEGFSINHGQQSFFLYL